MSRCISYMTISFSKVYLNGFERGMVHVCFSPPHPNVESSFAASVHNVRMEVHRASLGISPLNTIL